MPTTQSTWLYFKKPHKRFYVFQIKLKTRNKLQNIEDYFKRVQKNNYGFPSPAGSGGGSIVTSLEETLRNNLVIVLVNHIEFEEIFELRSCTSSFDASLTFSNLMVDKLTELLLLRSPPLSLKIAPLSQTIWLLISSSFTMNCRFNAVYFLLLHLLFHFDSV